MERRTINVIRGSNKDQNKLEILFSGCNTCINRSVTHLPKIVL